MGDLISKLGQITARAWSEVALSLVTVSGQMIGSTTMIGALIYELVAVGWVVWMISGKKWSFLPCNVFGICVSTYTLFKVVIAY